MCTAVTYKTKDFYMGRTLDYEFSYGEEVTIMPRNFALSFRNGHKMNRHYAIVGMAHVEEDYPLYYDGINEKGLGIAGLNFVGNAVYQDEKPGKDNLAQFELIPYLLGQCSSVQEAKKLLQNLNLTKEAFREGMPPSPLHWMLADERQAITIEAVEEGLKIYENPVGVLTNNPPFDKQLFGLNRYLGLSVREPQNTFSKKLELSAYSRGMGALGLPGDLSSSSRFVRAAFVKMNSLSGETEEESVSQFFHILGSVDQQRGCCEVAEGKYEITQYTSCCNAARGIYYYTTYDNHQITAVDMHREDLEAEKLIRYPKIEGEQIRMQN